MPGTRCGCVPELEGLRGRILTTMTLESLGWSAEHEHAFTPFAADGLVPARVAAVHRAAYELFAPPATLEAACTGRLLHLSREPADLPAVGDWVACSLRPGEERADIAAVLPRRSVFLRRAPDGRSEALAANVDVALVVGGLDGNHNPRRLERFLTVAREGGSAPVIVLNKADVREDAERLRDEVERRSGGAPVHLVSAVTGEGLEAVRGLLVPGRTLVLLGSSGVGKSTLLNALAGEDLAITGAAREADSRGRHTTTHRELHVLTGGALVVDTPGLRELAQASADAEALEATFDEIALAARQCRFRDCRHAGEPGCAVVAALETGEIEADRWTSFRRLQREQEWLESRENPQVARLRAANWKKIAKTHRQRERGERTRDA